MRIKQFRASALVLAAVFAAFAAYAETVSISTYYPSPYGSYQNLETTGNTNLATGAGTGVAIGKTTAATEKLDIVGNAIIAGNTTLGATGNILIGSQDANTVNLRPGVAGGDILISDDSAVAAGGITVLEGGNVGIGRSPGAYKLDVLGNANVEGTVRLTTGGQSGVLQVSCNTGANTCYAVYA